MTDVLWEADMWCLWVGMMAIDMRVVIAILLEEYDLELERKVIGLLTSFSSRPPNFSSLCKVCHLVAISRHHISLVRVNSLAASSLVLAKRISTSSLPNYILLSTQFPTFFTIISSNLDKSLLQLDTTTTLQHLLQTHPLPPSILNL